MKALKIIAVVLIILAIVYFIFKDKIDNFFSRKISEAPAWASCKETFIVKLPDGKTQSVFKGANAGTTDNPIYEFYKNDVTLTQDGITNPGDPIKITKDEFDGLCKYQFNPPYDWYKNPPTGSSGGHGRTAKMAAGGIVGNNSMPSKQGWWKNYTNTYAQIYLAGNRRNKRNK